MSSGAATATLGFERELGLRRSEIVVQRRNGTRVRLATYRGNESVESGPIIIYIHGMCGETSNFYWQMRQERNAYYSFDMFGCGESEKRDTLLSCEELQRWCAPSQLVDDVAAAWRDATRDGARPSLLVAHSYSTSLVTQWLAALERSERNDRAFDGARAARARRILGVVLLNTHASLPPMAASRASTLARRLPTALQLAAVDLVMGPVRWLRMLCTEDCSHGTLGERATPAARARWLEWERRKTAWLYASSVCSAEWARERDFARAYAALPLAVSWGERDTLTPVDARFWTQRHRVAPALCALQVCAGHGHWQFLDNPEFDAWFSAVREHMLSGAVALPSARLLEVVPRCIDAEIGEALPRCVVCDAFAHSRCGRCPARVAPAYCDPDCQQLHWERGHCDACAK